MTANDINNDLCSDTQYFQFPVSENLECFNTINLVDFAVNLPTLFHAKPSRFHRTLNTYSPPIPRREILSTEHRTNNF